MVLLSSWAVAALTRLLPAVSSARSSLGPGSRGRGSRVVRPVTRGCVLASSDTAVVHGPFEFPRATQVCSLLGDQRVKWLLRVVESNCW
jgi:hypothetical protein